MRAFLIVVLAGCGVAEGAEKPAPPKSRSSKLAIAWSNIEWGLPGGLCFSGPRGTDDRLVGTALVERAGSSITITIDRAVFRGTSSGNAVTLTRRSTHDRDGPWMVTETIEGRLVRGGIAAHYHYEECELTAKECPGLFTIDADLALRP